MKICDDPVFIVGCNRSGTTLVRLMLNAHPAFAIPEELGYTAPEIGGIPIGSWRRRPLGEKGFQALVEVLCRRNREVAPNLGAAEVTGRIPPGTPRDLRLPYAAYLEAFAASRGKPRWGEKTPINLFFADVLADWFPSARFVFVVRDPRAVVLSLGRMDDFASDAGVNALLWDRYAMAGYDTLARAVPAGRRRVVTYEALVTSPAVELERLCAFLGVPYDPVMLEYHRGSGAEMKGSAARGFNRLAASSVTPDRARAWEAEMDPQEAALVDLLTRRGRRRFGYPGGGVRPRLSTRLRAWATRGFGRYHAARNVRQRGFLLVWDPPWTRRGDPAKAPCG